MDSAENKYASYLQTILDKINEGIHAVDETGKTIIYNRKMAELENMERDSVLEKKLLDVFPSLDEESSTLLKTLKTGKIMNNNQQEYLNKYGQKITTINSTIPIITDSGARWALEIAKDITEIKNLYNKIIRLQERLFNKEEKHEDKSRYFTFADIKGRDEKFISVIKNARMAARTDSSVMIIGETGTGKELVAQSIHSASRRKNRPFIAQNCAALPENLLEGILFGTRKGGFTGAVDRQGLFEQADGGTLLLDEINSMSTSLQAKLLRVLQEGRIRPVGGKKDINVDVRIIATINISPVEAIKEGKLREDLYYRLAVVLLYLPLLAERKDDILLLTEYFIEKYNNKFNYQVQGVSKDVKRTFLKYRWPGNVRQLEHVIEGAINILEDDKIIREEHIRPYLIETVNSVADQQQIKLKIEGDLPLSRKMAEVEKIIVLDALSETDWNITRAAHQLGIRRQSLQYRIEKYNLKQ